VSPVFANKGEYIMINNIKSIIDRSSLADSLGTGLNIAIPQKESVVAYLKNGAIEAAAGRAKDIITGERIPGEWLSYTDGTYRWDTSLIYHFDRYNIKLPDEFIQHAISQKSRHHELLGTITA